MQVQAQCASAPGASGIRRAFTWPTVALMLSGCSSIPSSMNPVTWWHDLQGGKIAEERPPPPGSDQPYPNLASVPPKPAAPDRAELANIARALVADRTNAQHIAAAAPIADPSSPSASPALFGRGTAPPPPPPAPPGASKASATLQAAEAPPAPPAAPAPSAPAVVPAPSKAPVAAVQSAPLEAVPAPAAPAPAAQPPASGAPPPAAPASQAGGASPSAPAPVLAPPGAAAVPPAVAAAPPPPLPAAPPPPPNLRTAGTGTAVPPSPAWKQEPPPPPPTAVASATPAQPRPSSSGSTISVTFVNGSAELPATGADALKQLAARRGSGVIAVTGYGDAASSNPDAQSAALALGYSRAQAMAAALTSAGVPASAVQVDAAAIGRGGTARLVQ